MPHVHYEESKFLVVAVRWTKIKHNYKLLCVDLFALKDVYARNNQLTQIYEEIHYPDQFCRWVFWNKVFCWSMTYHPSGSFAATSDKQRIESESTFSCWFSYCALIILMHLFITLLLSMKWKYNKLIKNCLRAKYKPRFQAASGCTFKWKLAAHD